MLTPAHFRDLAIVTFALGAGIVFDGVGLRLAQGLVIFGFVAKTPHQAST